MEANESLNRFSPSDRPAQVDLPSANRRRRLRVVKPRIQLRLIGACLGFSVLSLLLQFLLFASSLSETAASMPVGGPILMGQLPRLLGMTLLVSALGLFPLIAIVGVLYTGRIVGPIYRFEVFLRDVVQGRQLGPCRLRDGDELQELCELINDATEPVRRRTRVVEEDVPLLERMRPMEHAS